MADKEKKFKVPRSKICMRYHTFINYFTFLFINKVAQKERELIEQEKIQEDIRVKNEKRNTSGRNASIFIIVIFIIMLKNHCLTLTRAKEIKNIYFIWIIITTKAKR